MRASTSPRYFVVGESGTKGPFTVEALWESARAERLSVSAVLRPELGGPDVRLEELPKPDPDALAAKGSGKRRRRRAEGPGDDDARGAALHVAAARARSDVDPESDDAPVHVDQGNFWLGLAAGAIGGIILIVLFLRSAKPETRRGIYWGLGLQVVFVIAANVFD